MGKLNIVSFHYVWLKIYDFLCLLSDEMVHHFGVKTFFSQNSYLYTWWFDLSLNFQFLLFSFFLQALKRPSKKREPRLITEHPRWLRLSCVLLHVQVPFDAWGHVLNPLNHCYSVLLSPVYRIGMIHGF